MGEPRGELDRRFSDGNAQPRAWSEVERVLDEAEMFWLSTVRADGRPHVTPLPAVWLDGSLHFCTSAGEQKERNLAANPHCILTTGSNSFRHGLDVVLEGRAERLTDEALLRRLAALWLFKLDWHFDVVDGAFRESGVEPATSAPVFSVRPSKVLAFGKGEPYSQTRFVF